MKKYFLFAAGDFSDKSKSQYVIDIIADITSTKYCKYKFSHDSITINFACNGGFDALSSHVKMRISEFVNYYILTEQTDNLSVFMKKEELDEFLSLDECNLNINNKTESKNENVLNDFIDLIMNLGNSGEGMHDVDEEEEQDEDILIKKSLKKEYNLDDILDKINEKGVSSLTKEENEYLKNLSK
jgi:hypothetical protein